MSEYMSPFAIFVVSVVGAGIGAYIGAYLREKGRNLATHEDIDRIVAQLRAMGEAAAMGREWDCYAEIVENQNRGPGQDAAAVEREVADGLS
jgi:hypothetical protein